MSGAQQQEPGPRRRSWPVRAGRRVARAGYWLVRAAYWLVRPFWAVLVAGEADPPSPRPGWRTPRWLCLRGRQLDLVVLGEILLVCVVFAGLLSSLDDTNDRIGDPVNGELLILATAGSSLPLLLRDRWPLAAWRIAVPSMIFTAVVTERLRPQEMLPPAGAGVMYLLVLYAVGVRCPRHISVGAWILSAAGVSIFYPGPGIPLAMVMAAVPLLFGYNVQVRRRAQRQVVVEERRAEDERAARAVLAERSRIARELHDVVAHHMSVIAIQAEAAPIKAPSDPEVLKAELAGIRHTALAALGELRRVLGVLREGDGAPVTAPQPDLSELDQLIAGARGAGQAVTVTTTGRAPEALGGVGLAAYRVLQESLSNARRHAPSAAVRVHLAYHDDRLELRVENDPPPHRPATPARGGRGLTGMRERVGAYGGSLATGPTPAGGFAVKAALPIEPAATVEST